MTMVSGVETAVPLRCPACRAPLQLGQQDCSCPACGGTWPVVDGVPYFVQQTEYWGEAGITQEVARDILARTATTSWREVLGSHALPAVRAHCEFISDLSRADWHRLVPLRPGSTVLDLGAGLGTISAALAAHCERVYAVEPVEERVRFLTLRFRQDGCHNISVIRANIDLLPFPDAFFDLIVLNGVLEWLPFSRTHQLPRDAQLYYLRLLRRLLKPGGTLYVGIENRYCIHFFLGAADPHIGIRGVTVLPRFLADAICRIKTGDRYRPYLYSHRGYRRLLLEAGFREVELYSALPSYNRPQQIHSLGDPSGEFADAVWDPRNRLARGLRRLLISTDLLKYAGYAYIAFGRN